MQKTLVYAQALQYWAEKANLPMLGQPCLLVRCVQELRWEMKPYMTLIDDTILEGVTPQQELQEGQTRESGPVETLTTPIPKDVKDTQAEESGVPPISQKANELDAAEEPTDELTILTATMGELAEEPDPPPMQWEVGKEGRGPSSNFPGWTEVIHPAQLVTPARWAPLTLGELKWHCHSQSSGGRRAQHQWAEEYRMVAEGKSCSTSLWGSPGPIQGKHCPQALWRLWPV